jgi:hypothetical protein
MNKILRTVNADNLIDYKVHVIREYGSFRKDLTQSGKANSIVKHANLKGWTEWTYFSGQSLKRVGFERPITKWMIDSVFEILTQMEWQPISDRVWALFIKYWMFEHGPFNDVGGVLDSLPLHMDKNIAEEWVRFFEVNLPDSKRTQRIYSIVDEMGRKITYDNISLNFAKRELEEIDGGINWTALTEQGYRFVRRHIFFEEIEQENEIPEFQKALVRKKIVKITITN